MMMITALAVLGFVLAQAPQEAEVWERLGKAPRNNRKRAEALAAYFESAGCSGERLKREPVKGSKEPNIICTLPGESDSIIVIAAHHDHGGLGEGVVDNWSGAVMLPALYKGLASAPRHHTYVLAGFAGEEKGLLGARAFLEALGEGGVRRVRAMINIDSVGLSPTKIWVGRADPVLVEAITRIAASRGLPLSGSGIELVGESDSGPFHKRGIAVLDIHSVTTETLPVLHSAADNVNAIRREDYLQTFQLVAAFAESLDGVLRKRSGGASGAK
jgi:Zn-dependent M28 family amino/carboxypeptidase